MNDKLDVDAGYREYVKWLIWGDPFLQLIQGVDLEKILKDKMIGLTYGDQFIKSAIKDQIAKDNEAIEGMLFGLTMIMAHARASTMAPLYFPEDWTGEPKIKVVDR